jgi:hypothetical protein
VWFPEAQASERSCVPLRGAACPVQRKLQSLSQVGGRPPLSVLFGFSRIAGAGSSRPHVSSVDSCKVPGYREGLAPPTRRPPHRHRLPAMGPFLALPHWPLRSAPPTPESASPGKGRRSAECAAPWLLRAGYLPAGAILLSVITLPSALTVPVALTVLPAFFSNPAKLWFSI